MLKPAIYRAVYLGCMFAASLIMANLLQPEGLGQLSLLILNASLISLITGMGSDSMALHALAQQKWSANYGISFLAKMFVIQLVVFCGLQLFSFLLWKQSLLAGDINLFWVELAYFIGLVITEKALIVFYSLHRSKEYNMLLLVIGVIYLLVLTTLWVSNIEVSLINLFWLAAFHTAIQGIILLMVMLVFYKKLEWVKIQWIQTKSIMKAASIIMLTNVIQLLAYRIDYWLLRYFHSNYEVGLYAQANKFASLLWLLPNILATLLIPKFSSLETCEVPSIFRIANFLNVAMAALTVIATTVIYKYFLADQFGPGLSAFWIMLPGYFCWSMVIFFGAYFSWAGAFTSNLFASSFCLLLICISDLLLIPRFGVNGAALANTIVYSLVLLLYFYMFTKKLKLRPYKITLWTQRDFLVAKKMLA